MLKYLLEVANVEKKHYKGIIFMHEKFLIQKKQFRLA